MDLISKSIYNKTMKEEEEEEQNVNKKRKTKYFKVKNKGLKAQK